MFEVSDSSSACYLLYFRFQLKPYQLIGLKWLILLHEHKLSGILADEMVRKPVRSSFQARNVKKITRTFSKRFMTHVGQQESPCCLSHHTECCRGVMKECFFTDIYYEKKEYLLCCCSLNTKEF